MHVLLTIYGVLVCGAVSFAVGGALAAIICSKLMGNFEGKGSMTGFCLFGPLAGLTGAILGGIYIWRILAEPGLAGTVALTETLGLAVLIGAIFFISMYSPPQRKDFPRGKAHFHVEVSFPQDTFDALKEADAIEYQLRAGEGKQVAAALRDRARREDGRVIVPASFAIRWEPCTKLLAVMINDEQLMCATLHLGDSVGASPDPSSRPSLLATTDWSPWEPMEEGLLARWRLVVTP